MEGGSMFKFLKEKLFRFKKDAKDLKPEELVSEDQGKLIKSKKLDRLLDDLEMSMLESDVSIEVVEELKRNFRQKLEGKRIARGVDFEDAIDVTLRNSIQKILSKPFDFLGFIDKTQKPVVIMFVGVNGTGKTTVIARMAHLLMKNKKTCVLAASDTFRAGAIEQLEKHSQNLGIKLVKHKAGSDPAAVAFDAIEHAKARHRDVVLIDTAGRMQTNINLMDEMKKIKRVAKPNLIVFVGDSLAGNDAVDQAKRFDQAVGIDTSILTKLDADTKGGAALSIAFVTQKPILYLGIGQDYDDMIPFDPKWMVDRLFSD
jgi:fused signal recognition particle receptor